MFLVRFEIETGHRQERQIQIADFAQQGKQSRLIDDRAGEKGFTSLLMGDGYALKPVGPIKIEVTFDSYCVDYCCWFHNDTFSIDQVLNRDGHLDWSFDPALAENEQGPARSDNGPTEGNQATPHQHIAQIRNTQQQGG